MRRFKLVFAVVAMLAVMVATAAPAMANDNDGWWDNCEWVLFPWWGWYVVCEVDDSWWGHDDWQGHDDWDDDNDDDHDEWWRHDGRW